jgi:hypothetical protein
LSIRFLETFSRAVAYLRTGKECEAMRKFIGFLLAGAMAALASCKSESGESAPAWMREMESAEASAVAAGDLSALLKADSVVFDPSKYEIVDGVVRLSWKLLAKMDFYEKYNEEVEALIDYPIFHPDVKALEGRSVAIEGYVIPVEETGDETLLILSAFPYSQCFFCGQAGPESVMDIQLRQKPRKRLELDRQATFQGKLRLNDTDLYYLNYILEEAVMLP